MNPDAKSQAGSFGESSVQKSKYAITNSVFGTFVLLFAVKQKKFGTERSSSSDKLLTETLIKNWTM